MGNAAHGSVIEQFCHGLGIVDIMVAHVQMRDSSGAQAQGGNREYQPICSSKTFTTIVDQPLEKEVLPRDASVC